MKITGVDVCASLYKEFDNPMLLPQLGNYPHPKTLPFTELIRALLSRFVNTAQSFEPNDPFRSINTFLEFEPKYKYNANNTRHTF